MGGLAMEPAEDSCSNSPPSTPSTSSSTALWISRPIRIRDSVSRPRRSLLSAHFCVDEGKAARTESPPFPADGLSKSLPCPPLPADGLSKSLPSPPISAFLDKQEEEAFEPTTPPHTATFLPPPMAPRKILKQRAPSRAKHKPRRLLFGDGKDGEDADPDSSQRCINGALSPPQKSLSVNGALIPPHQSFNSFATSPTSALNQARRIHMQDLR